MSVVPQFVPLRAPSRGVRIAAGPAAVVAIAALAALLQLRLGVYTDQLWLMTLCARMVDGARPYVDFLENSPPFAVLLYLPPVLIARVLGVSREAALLAYELAMFGASLWASWRILRRAGLAQDVGPFGAAAAGAALLLLPDYAFGQRDHFALALSAPLLAACAARAEAREVGAWSARLAAAAAALALMVRPHYAAALAPAFGFVAWRRGLSAAIRLPETTALALACVAMAALSLALFPAYFTHMLPIVLAVYVPDRESFGLMAILPPFVAWAMMAAGHVAQRRAGEHGSLSMVAALASVGAIVSYFAQGKGLPYHALFASISMAFALAMGARRAVSAPWILFSIALGLAILASGGLAWRVSHIFWFEGLVLACVVVVVVARFAPPGRRVVVALRAVGLLFGTAGAALAVTALHAEWPPHFLFEKRIAALKNHPAIAAITEIGEMAHPLVSRVEGRWTQSVISGAISFDIDRQIARAKGDETLLAKLEGYKEVDVDLFMADMARDPPDAVIVDETFLAEHFGDSRVIAFLARLKRDDAVTLHEAGGRARTFELYVR